jgi:PAS domain S-box-containing protein
MISNNPARPVEIMVLAGTQEDLSLLSSMLHDHGYQVQPVDSCELALSALKCRKPDLILLDDGCSNMNIELLCQKIRENGMTNDIPMICITQMNKRTAAQKFEGSDYISRPCREEELLRKVNARLESRLVQKGIEEMNRSLYAAQETLRTTLNSLSEGVICTDEEGSITMINDAARSMTGWLCDSAIGRHIHTVLHLKSEKAQESEGNTLKAADTVKSEEIFKNTVLIAKDGIDRPITHRATPIMDDTGRPAGFVIVFGDVTCDRRQLNEIDFLSYHDHLTELYNRRFLEAELCRQDDADKLPITLVMGDLNGLKITNDAFGHFAGDDPLRTTAAILKKCF